MKKFKAFIFLTTLLYYSLPGQDIQLFLGQVAGKNPEIIAYSKLLEARKFEAGTDLTPPDPEISLGYMPGHNPDEGVKKTWSVTQSFSFPGKYITMSRLSKEKIILAEQEYDLARLNILLNVKYLVFDHIYNRKKLRVLAERKELYDQLRTVWQRMLETGEATILEYNRIRFALSGIDLDISRARADLSVIDEKLSYAVGGSTTVPDFFEYPGVVESQPALIIQEKTRTHPAFLLPESEYRIGLKELNLNRYGSLPEFHAGYGSEITPGEAYTGPFAGMTIPLWSNTRKVKTASAMASHLAAARDAVIAELTANVRGEYQNLVATGKSISELRELLDQEKQGQYPDMALKAGEISLTDYFLYLESSFGSEDRLMELENEYNKIAASLHDQELLQLMAE